MEYQKFLCEASGTE